VTTASDDARDGWKGLPPAERNNLIRAAGRGERGINRRDAAYMLWWSSNELRRGPWPALRVAAIVVAGVLVTQAMTLGADFDDLEGFFQWVGLLPVVLLIPMVSWTLRRPKLQRAAQLNAAVLAGKPFEGPPDPEDAERLLARARKEGWFRGTRPDPT
jgi:hypothetical protein